MRFLRIPSKPGLTLSKMLLLSRISYLGRVICKPGEEEMDSLAYYLNAVLTGELQPKEYN